MQQSRFLWYFENANYTTRHGELNWAVYLDPQTGDIIDEEGYNSYFEDKTVCLKNAS